VLLFSEVGRREVSDLLADRRAELRDVDDARAIGVQRGGELVEPAGRAALRPPAARKLPRERELNWLRGVLWVIAVGFGREREALRESFGDEVACSVPVD
jgi:hypothetical protein